MWRDSGLGWRIQSNPKLLNAGRETPVNPSDRRRNPLLDMSESECWQPLRPM